MARTARKAIRQCTNTWLKVWCCFCMREKGEADNLQACKLPATTTKPNQGIQIPGSDTSTCPSAQIYTTKAGDTCDSIAQGNKVSSATLYDTNPMLLDCDAPGAGLQLCLPSKCAELHSVQDGDTCSSIGSSAGASWQQIIQWNSILNQACSNIHNSKPSWGHTLCVSPPGGVFSTAPPVNGTDGGVGGPGGNGDGYADSTVNPPSGVSLAPGTTTKCGQFHIAESGETCVVIVTNAGTPSDLFIAVNPSLRAADGCDARLQVGRAYCVSPIRAWNATDVAIPSNVPTASSTTKPSTTLASATSTPAPSGIVSTDGTCGGTSGFICTGQLLCCSEYGWCGDTSAHCGAGCQSDFGDCTSAAPRVRRSHRHMHVGKHT